MHIPSTDHTTVSSPSGIHHFMRRHALICYFVLAYGFSWLAWVPYVLSQDGLGVLPFRPGQIAFLPGAYLGPLLSGLLMAAVTEGKPGVGRLLRRLVQWRVKWYWYLFALVGIPVISFLGFLAMPGSLGALHSPTSQIIILIPLLLIMEILTSGLAEEPGWRGFALPRLQLRFGALLASIILGVMWQCWHLPLYLTSWGNGAGVLEIFQAIAACICMTIVITWVFNHTRGSLLIAILQHAALDASGVLMAGSLFTLSWLLQNSHMALQMGFGVVALVLIIATRGRLGYKRPASDTVATYYEGNLR